MKQPLIERLRDAEKQGFITLRPNNSGTLLIANYTPKVQFDRLWNDLTLSCRGLIVDNNGTVVARPFGKFFNIEELDESEIPDESFKVYEKMDGSLGILYYDDGFKIATRGSFNSGQAIKGTEMINETYLSYIEKHDPYLTYLFEIIYPENRIVVDYGRDEKLVLIAIIETATGRELPLSGFNFPHKAKEYDITELSELRDHENDRDEGFVVRFTSGMRVKVKFSEYVRLHRIITGVSNKSIWEYLKTGQSFDEILDMVPDEFYDWVKQTRQNLVNEYGVLNDWALDTYAKAPAYETRKEFALWAKQQKHPALLFNILTGRKLDSLIWKMIKPEYEKPYTIES